MKRHRSLYPLSRDHHHALVQARNLGLAAEANDTDEMKRAAENFAAFWRSELHAHFSQEDRFVLPLLAGHTPESDEVRRTLKEHAEIRRLTEELNDKLIRAETIEAGLLQSLGETLRSHIRFEENELFPAVESSATEEELTQLNEQLEMERSGSGQAGCAL